MVNDSKIAMFVVPALKIIAKRDNGEIAVDEFLRMYGPPLKDELIRREYVDAVQIRMNDHQRKVPSYLVNYLRLTTKGKRMVI